MKPLVTDLGFNNYGTLPLPPACSNGPAEQNDECIERGCELELKPQMRSRTDESDTVKQSCPARDIESSPMPIRPEPRALQ